MQHHKKQAGTAYSGTPLQIMFAVDKPIRNVTRNLPAPQGVMESSK